MEQDDTCHTGLVLGLNTYDATSSNISSINDQNINICSKLLERSSSNLVSHEPCLTLCLSNDRFDQVKAKLSASKASCSSSIAISTDGIFLAQTTSPDHHSISSSFSDDAQPYSFKTDHIDNIEETTELGIASQLIGCDEYDDIGNARKKLRLTKEQYAFLEDEFKQNTTLNPKQKQVLAKTLNLRPRQVEVWFQNRRARTKLKQTQVDYELLKQFCQKLKNENKRLHKELQELKAIKFSSTLHDRNHNLSTLTLCSSCERRITAKDDSKGGIPAKPKSLHFNPFAHSAAC